MNDKILKQDDRIMKLLEVSTINRVICHTNKGVLTLQIRKGETNYHLVLDAVPLLPDLNKELMDILFPAKPQEVPQVNKESNLDPITGTVKLPTPKKKGRPKKVNG